MKSEKEQKDVDINDVAITLEVESGVIQKVRTGAFTHIIMDVNEQNQNLILENIKGNLILVTDDTPETYHGCYLYNNGKFPYAIKGTLAFLVLSDGKDDCLARIIDVSTEPGMRFNYQGAGQPIVENDNGDSCVWEVSFEIVPVPKESRIYLMRWNPSISSFTEKAFEECVANMVHGMFRLNWSIHDWQEARRGDYFFMLRTGDDKAGIAFNGQFLSDPYPDEDWAGSTKRRMYVDMICMNPMEPGEKPSLSLEKLQTAIPAIEWSEGHSGILLPDDVAEKLGELFQTSTHGNRPRV